MQAGGPWPRKRPDRWQHPTTRHGIPDVFPCPEGGVHRCCTDRRDRRNKFGFVSPDAIRTEIGRPRASRRLSAAMVTLSRSRDIDRGFLPRRKRLLAYLSEITFDPTCGFAVPRRCACPGGGPLEGSAGETVQRWPSSVTT